MKTTAIVRFSLCFSLLFSSALWMVLTSGTTHLPPEKVNIFEALDRKQVTVRVASNGYSSEDCIRMFIRNISGKPLQVSVPAGTLMNTKDTDQQDILLTRPENVFVDAGNTVTQTAYGFCCQASNGVPAEDEEFVLQQCSDPRLVKLATHIAEKEYDPGLIQSAIWAISDEHSVGGIYNDNKTQCDELRQFTAELLGTTVPFYDVDYGYELNTPFVYEPRTLKGEMSYQLTTAGKATLNLYAPDGSVYYTFYTNRPMGKARYRQQFEFTASNMEQGEYRVVLTVNGVEVNEQVIVL